MRGAWRTTGAYVATVAGVGLSIATTPPSDKGVVHSALDPVELRLEGGEPTHRLFVLHGDCGTSKQSPLTTAVSVFVTFDASDADTAGEPLGVWLTGCPPEEGSGTDCALERLSTGERARLEAPGIPLDACTGEDCAGQVDLLLESDAAGWVTVSAEAEGTWPLDAADNCSLTITAS